MQNKKVLILQFRPETEVADDEYQAFLKYGKLQEDDVERIRAEHHLPDIDLEKYSAVLVGGSPYTISDPESKKSKEQIEVENKLISLMQEIKEKDFPYFGNCYGIGTMATACGGIVSQEKYGEDVGAVTIKLTEEGKKDKLLAGLPEEFRAFVGHKEACQITPPDATLLALSDTCPVEMFRFGENVYALQFHAELDYEGLALRIDYYKNKGYFPPEDAETLKEKARPEKIEIPMKILERFMDVYYRS